jgi:sodium/proline symporter
MTANTPTIVTFAIYLLGMLLIGWAGYKATSNLSDYILGGRSLGSVVTALSAGASDMSGWLLMGLPGAVFATGLSASWIASACASVPGSTGALSRRLRVYTEKVGNALTLPDYFTNRFEDRSSLLRIVTALVILVFFTVYCASGVVAGARLFESMFGMDYQTALWVGAVATMAYVFIGGFLAVSWTDTIQASLMITALILAPLMVIYADGSGCQRGHHRTARSGASTCSGPGSDCHHLLAGLGSGLLRPAPHSGALHGGRVDQDHSQRAPHRHDLDGAVPGRRRGRGLLRHCLLCQPPRYCGKRQWQPRTRVPGSRQAAVQPLDQRCAAGRRAGGRDEHLSCQLLVCSSALTQDIYKTFLHRNASQKQLVWFGRAMVFAIAVIAILIAQDPKAKVLGMVSNAWAGFGAAFGPLVLISLLWARMTRNGALAGMVVGAVTVLVWQHYQWFKLYEIVPGFALSAIAIIVVSLLDKEPSATITAKHREVEAEIAAHGE